MPDQSEDTLPLEQQLALAHCSGKSRAVLASFLRLDNRLGRFVSRASEPIVTQLRLAWWRDQLGKKTAERPTGDHILDGLSQAWSGDEVPLINLVDAWESLLAEPPLSDDVLIDFCNARAACFANAVKSDDGAAAKQAGFCWAFADYAQQSGDDVERKHIADLAKPFTADGFALPYRWRSIAILGELGRRAIERGGGPMVSSRRDALVISRLGLLGR